VKEGTFQWCFSEAPAPLAINWNSGEPNNAGGNENCCDISAYVGTVPNNIKFNDYSCEIGKKKYLCEVK
jgi:hypothetical protein